MSAKPYAVVRAITIDAPAAIVRAHVEDLSGWRSWSPWPQLSDDTVVHIGEPGAGVGARMEWIDDRRIGSGFLEVVESEDSLVVVDMDSQRPRSSGNVMVFLLDPSNGSTRLTWTMHGEVMGIRRVGAWVWPIGKSIGPGFSRGLARLKGIVEGTKS